MDNQSMQTSQKSFISIEMLFLREAKRYEFRKALIVRTTPADILFRIKRHAHVY
jgi:hypothetical protein